VTPKADKVKTTAADKHVMAGRLAKAKQFLQVAEDARELASDEAVIDAVVTLYVHAGIAAADAICAKNLNKHAQGENHNAAVDLLASVDKDAAKHLSTLLKMKSRAGYGHDSVSHRNLTSAERAATQLVAIASEG
jgi:hypothetical protein